MNPALNRDASKVSGGRPGTVGRSLVTAIPLLLVGLAMAACGAPNVDPDPASWLALDAPAMPNTTVEMQPGWDQFAWNSFIALNYPAIAPGSSNPNDLRGFPDTKTFASITAAGVRPATTTVWETLKEKRELFNHPPPAVVPAWNAPVDYGPIRMGDSKPVTVPAGSARIFHQGHKSTFDSLDETTEVQSEAREDAYPDGTANPVKGFVVSPRIYQKATVNGKIKYYPVLYEVKVNWDFYNYVIQNGYFESNADASAQVYTDASLGTINLPYRTSSAAQPGGPAGSDPTKDQRHLTVVGYDSQTVLGHLKDVANDPAAFTGTPPPVGSIHLKAVWILLQDPETGVNLVSNPDAYHQATAAYFLSNPGGEPIMQESLFGLVGLHIIQRVHAGLAGPGTKGAQVGGTFIFATFEHEDVDTLDFVYSNFYVNRVALPPPVPQTGWYPPDLDNAYKVEPLLPYNPILDNTAAVNRQVKQKLAGSFWANYRLRGTQFTAINFDDKPAVNPQYPPSVADPTGIGQPVFLGNLLAETNHGLQHFQGQPPGTDPIPNYFYNDQSKVAHLPDRPPYPSNAGNEGPVPTATGIPGPFQRDNANMSHGRTGHNMGGCMGCHGVVQSRGFSFSFVLLGGYLGSATDTQRIFDSQPATLPDGAN